MTAQPRALFTLAEYREMECHASTKHEYVNGEIYAMAGATPRHNHITRNALTTLTNQLRGKPCVPFGSDQRVHVPETDLDTYPDVTVARPPLAFSPDDENEFCDATVIVEVLSPSTETFDRGGKFLHFKCLPSLCDYVLVSQDRVSVEHRFRDANSEAWRIDVFVSLDDLLHLCGVEGILSVRDLYERVEFS